MAEKKAEPWFQDIGKPLTDSTEEYFYKAGFSSFNGTSKFHLYQSCRVLVNGRPDPVEGKGVFRDTFDKGTMTSSRICRVCLKKKEKGCMEVIKTRYLIHHPESSCWFEVFGEDDLRQTLESEPCCVDVTGVPEHEEKFREYASGESET